MPLPKAITELTDGLPAEPDRVDARGRVDSAAACRRLGVDPDELGALVASGGLSASRDDEGRYWFEHEDLERVAHELRHRQARRGRPPIGVPVEVRLPSALLARIDALACDGRISRSEAVRRLLSKALEE
jgi:hypothetical protein